ncbi:hypothetical protein PG990_007136 [Apiospora arundinis]
MSSDTIADAGTTAPLKKREVAASFLFRRAPDDPSKVQVALFRRSGEVRTYQHKLAPISGSVDEEDANPQATALREIKEETTLELQSDIELLRRGKPYSFVDESIGRQWTIHPFAFRLKPADEGGKGEAGIVIDWEHEGWEWHDPLRVGDLDGFGGVPKLRDSLRRVWPEIDLGIHAGGVLEAGLLHLQTDHESGARQLAAKAVSVLRDVIVAKSESETHASSHLDNTWWANVRMVAWHLWKNGRESMGAAIVSALVSILDCIEEIWTTNGESDDDKLQSILGAIDEYLAQRELAVSKIQSSFAGLVKDHMRLSKTQTTLKVLTLSSSTTIFNCLLQATAALDAALDLRILESRPLCEGVTLASKLLQSVAEVDGENQQRVNIALYSDASAALASEGVDLVLLGADQISAAGDVSNKTGSLPAVLSAKHVAPDTLVAVLSEVEKIAGPGVASDHAVEENDPAELTRAWQQCAVKGADVVMASTRSFPKQPGIANAAACTLEVKNIYFEWVPASLIGAYVTDEGVWSAAEIQKRSDRIGVEMQRFFGDL